MDFGNFLKSAMATQQARRGVPPSGFGSNMNTAMGAALSSVTQGGINSSFNNSLPSASFASGIVAQGNRNQQFQLGGTPRPADPRTSIKCSGAPVSFSPSSVKTMNGMFGSPMQNSYDRSMSPMKQDMMMNDVSANVDPITGMPVNDVMY